MIHPLLRSADFVRVLRVRTQASSVHFAVHHLAAVPSVPQPPLSRAAKALASPDLSTGASEVAPASQVAVWVAASGSIAAAVVTDQAPENAIWFGAVVPKRHAKRSVTRSLLKRQIRNVVARHGETLACGLWVIRLRAPFDRKVFTSAASDQLKCAAREELDLLLASAARRAGRAGSSAHAASASHAGQIA